MVHAGGATSEDAETESVGTIFCDHFHRINNIALGFGHLFAMFVEDEAMEIDFFEWDFAGDVESHHDHTGDPSE